MFDCPRLPLFAENGVSLWREAHFHKNYSVPLQWQTYPCWWHAWHRTTNGLSFDIRSRCAHQPNVVCWLWSSLITTKKSSFKWPHESHSIFLLNKINGRKLKLISHQNLDHIGSFVRISFLICCFFPNAYLVCPELTKFCDGTKNSNATTALLSKHDVKNSLEQGT